MSKVFNKEMARSGSRHCLAKASILNALKQYQYVIELLKLVNRHVWYTLCTPRQKQIERHRNSGVLGEASGVLGFRYGVNFFWLLFMAIASKGSVLLLAIIIGLIGSVSMTIGVALTLAICCLRYTTWPETVALAGLYLTIALF